MQICKKNGGERMADSRSTYLKCKEEKKKERKKNGKKNESSVNLSVSVYYMWPVWQLVCEK